MAPNKREDPKGATPEQRKALAQAVKDDTVAFTSPEGKKLTLSAEKMVLAQARKEKATGEAARGEGGSVREARLLKEAIASVISRGYTVATDTIATRNRSKESGVEVPNHPKTPDKTNTRVEVVTPPTLKRFPRSDDTKAALKENEASIAELKARVDERVKEYEDNNDAESRYAIRTGIERNVARLQSQFEKYDGQHYTTPTNTNEAPVLIPKSAPQQAVIRQRQAVYKEALTAINDIDFQEKLDQREKQGPEMEEAPKTLNNNSDTELHATDKQGARTSEEELLCGGR